MFVLKDIREHNNNFTINFVGVYWVSEFKPLTMNV